VSIPDRPESFKHLILEKYENTKEELKRRDRGSSISGKIWLNTKGKMKKQIFGKCKIIIPKDSNPRKEPA